MRALVPMWRAWGLRAAVCLLVVSLAFVSAAPAAAAEVDPSGHWEGAIELPGSELEISVDLSRQADGAWSGDISIPAQGARDLPLGGVKVEGEKVAFEMPGVPGAPAFKGTLAAGGDSIAGEFTQGGQTFPFTLRRGAAPEAAASEALAGFDDLVQGALKEFKVPGAAVAIVVNGKVVLSKGYGLRDVKKNLPVTPQTLFAIGSSSKAFTTLVMGTLVDEGRLEWDRPVADYLPGFRLQDRNAGEKLTPRDLVTHRSGLPRHDAVWYNATDLSRRELVERLAYLEPFKDLRAQFHYQNLMFLTAGYLIEQVTGGTWEEAVRKRVFEPLGMTRSNFSVLDSQRSPDVSMPYDERDDEVKEIPFRVITNMGPAGSINSSVEEMSRWVRLHLGGGKIGDAQVVSGPTLKEMQTPQMSIAAPPLYPEIQQTSYGLGWFVEAYRGHKRVHHGGNIDGFAAMVSMLPDDGIGMVVLSNMNGTPVPELLVRHAFDRLLKLEAKDWIGEARARREKGKEAGEEAKKKKDLVRRSGTKPGHDLAEYAGEYENPGYGRLRVDLRDRRLQATYNGITSPLEHWHYEVFNALKGDDPAFEDMKLMFLTSMKGDVDSVQVPLEPEVKDIVFKKRPDARMSDPAYLKQFLGEYDFAGQVVTVGMKGSGLTLNVPGQPQYDLVADIRLDEFNLKQVSVVSVRFTVDPKEGVTEALISQPEGVFTAKRRK